MERVVVTGCGVASPLGCNVESYWAKLLAGESGVVALDSVEFAGLRSRIGARLAGYAERDHFEAREARRLSRASQAALVAAAEAVRQAGLEGGAVAREEVGVVVASSIGGFAASDGYFRRFYQGSVPTSPLIIPLSMNSAPASNISIRYGFQGPMMNVDAACASAAHAIGYCYHLIRAGVLELAVTGGADSPFSRGVMAAWCNLRALSERNDDPARACRPFSADRDGMVLGEGAGILVLEAERSAVRRGWPILAEVKGYGATGDSFHLTQPTPAGPARAIRQAVASAGLQPAQVDWISAHGTGTPWNDRTETAAIKAALAGCAGVVPVVAHKAALGHAIAASAALQAIAGVLSIRDQVLPPTINYTTPDPECDLDYVTNGARQHAVTNVACNSFAFGGSNAVLVLGRYDPAHS